MSSRARLYITPVLFIANVSAMKQMTRLNVQKTVFIGSRRNGQQKTA